MDDISIHRVGPDTGHILDRTEAGVFNDPIERIWRDAYLEFPGSMLVVAVHAGLVVGQIKAALHLHPDKPADLYIDEVGVAPTHRRRGIARRMLGEIEVWATERGCADIWLAADVDNAQARALYGRFAEAKPCLLYFWDL